MSARILPFRRPLSPVPEHIPRRDYQPDVLQGSAGPWSIPVYEIMPPETQAFMDEVRRKHEAPEKPGA